jgi:branched-subunit amino acid transport protein AzlD
MKKEMGKCVNNTCQCIRYLATVRPVGVLGVLTIVSFASEWQYYVLNVISQ